MKFCIVAGAMFAMVLTACGVDSSSAPGSVDRDDATSTPTSPDGPSLTTIPAKPEPTDSLPAMTTAVPSGTVTEAEASARKLLMEMLDIPGESIETEVAERVVWNNGSLGCPQPGFSYTQARVSGFRVVLVVDGAEYSFHGAQDRPIMYCPDPSQGFNPDA